MHSEITEEVLSTENLEMKLKDWMSHVAETLLFVRNINDIKLFVIDEKQPTENMTWNTSNLAFYACSNRGEVATVKVSDTAKLFSYPMTLFTQGSQPTEWIVQLGEGNVEDDDIDWDKIKPPNVACLPHHAIAAPLQLNKFEGKAFCYLPLPGTTILPIHIHGQFALQSNRRSLWISSSTKSEGIISGEIELRDPNDVWNNCLISAIAVSYAHFLINLTSTIKPPISQSMLIQSYYNYFALVNHGSPNTWSHLTVLLYKTLYRLNAPVLAKLAEKYSFDKENNEEFYNRIDWCKLVMHNSQNDCFFYNKDLTIVNVLKSIGMNLINAPLHIQKQFKKADENMKLPVVSKKSIIQYYNQFSSHILNGNTLPCPISSTKFSEIKYLSLLLEYLMEFGAFTVDCNHVANLGLVVTADGNLHALSDGEHIISSNSWTLFPSSKYHFIHCDLQIQYPPDSLYLCTFNPETNSHWRCILSILKDNYPLSPCGEMDTTWIKNIFNCLTNDLAFSVHCDEILNQFPLLPASNNQLYSTQSEVLPLTSTAGKFSNKPDYNIEKVKKLLTTLNVPLLLHELVGNILDKVKIQLPSVQNPPDVLKSLYLLRKDKIILTLTQKDLSLLFMVFAQISFSNKDNQIYIRHLPVFTTTNGDNVTLASGSLILIWNDREVCSAGRDQWIKHISSSVLFLDASAPWACIEHEAKNLQIKRINRYDFYCDFIIPNFHFLDPAVQQEHLRFIKAEIYPYCEHIILCSHDYYKVQKVNLFVSAFRMLKCISDSSGKLRSIASFYDHNDILFQTFCSESYFLPDNYREEEWYKFLVYFGLKTVPTNDEFIAYCKCLPNMGSAEAIKYASSVLLSALFYSPKHDENKYKNIQSSKYICDIPIAVVAEMPDLDSIKTQKMGEHIVQCGGNTVYLTRLFGSSTVDNKYLLWTIRPLIDLPCDPDPPKNGRLWNSTVCNSK